jgi:purine-cytosine permease-like protein
MLASEAPDHDRTRIFAHYSLIGGLSTAAGALAAAAPTALVSIGVSYLDALKTMFYFYAAMGLLAASIYRYLPSRAEMSATVYFPTVAIRHLPIAAIICDEADPETALVLELV